MQTKAGNIGEALRLYQRALQLDDAAADKRASAVDWFAYGQFLDAAGFPLRMVYACYVKSESMENSLRGVSLVVSLKTVRQQIEKRLGAEAVAVRHDPEPVLRQALALRQ